MFVETAFTNFKKTYDICDAHADRQYHKDAVVACDAFIERMSGECSNSAQKRTKGNYPENQREAPFYCGNNCLVWSPEYCTSWAS